MSHHLGMQVSAYVDRRLDARELHAYDQHLAVCLVCRHAAEQERRLLTSLRSGPTPGFSPDLQSMLLALAQPSRPTQLAPDHDVPPIPAAPPSVRQLRIPTVPPAAPPLHRSPRRAAAIAGLAAGASAVAAIGLAVVSPTQGAAATVVRPAGPRAPGSATVAAVPAFFSGAASSPLRQALGDRGR